jgi:2-polyprenyl-3-methyl-5-hydroxy-6-metoxy-1,4-benzoquinol methylase
MTSNSKHETRCILCDSQLVHLGQDFAGKQIYQCEQCEYAMTPAVESAEASALYDNPEYFDGWGCNLEFDYDRFEPSVHQQVKDYLDFIAAHTRGKSLLDVGTGSGLLPHLARSNGYEVEGTDLSKHVSDNVPARAGFPIHHGTLEEIKFTRTYDIITMLHVLEHTSNPLATLQRSRELLNDGGYLIVVVPNYKSLDTHLKNLLSRFKLKSRPYKHLALGHHNFVFSIKSLEILGKKAGLQVVHRQTRQPAWRTHGWHRFLEQYGMATWCWIVYQRPIEAGKTELRSLTP